MRTINASIITIGDELLIGQVIDTNSSWMAAELNKIGVWVKRRVAVGDNKEAIIHALNEESKSSDVILITGGLGPTPDDITKPVLCDYFGGKLVINEDALANVKVIFEKLNRPLIDRNIQQATVPDICTVIPNRRGTAPGMWFEKDGRIYISMPGVPHEMKGMMTDDVLPRLPFFFSMPHIVSRTLLTAGIGEAFLAELIKGFESVLPDHIKLAYLPAHGMVRLRLTAIGENKEIIEAETSQQFDQLKTAVKEYLITDKDETIAQVVSRKMREQKKTLATAESCTGGYIAHLITAETDASTFYQGSVVSYANEVKQRVLNVSPVTLQEKGAVSEAVVRQMVQGVIEQVKTDYAIAVSGIMGPGGGSEAKPVGTVWIAVGNTDNIWAQKFHFRYDRLRNIEMTANQALLMLYKLLITF